MNIDYRKKTGLLPGFALRLSIAIEQEDILERDLAMRTGIEPMAISQFTRGRSEPGIAELIRILRALPGVNARWLICG